MSTAAQPHQIPSRVIGLSIVIAAAAAGWLIGHSSSSLSWSLNHQIFADNRTTTSMCLVLAAFYAMHWHTAPAYHMRRQFGFVVVCISLAAHREVWAWWRWYLGHGDKASADWIRDDLAWLTSVAQLGVWIGLGMMLSAFAARYYGARGDWMVAAGVIGSWCFWFLIAAGWS